MEWTVDTLLLLLIPLTSALVGWFTNYLAVKMMFYPVEFVGIRPIFGWQGLIPAKRRKMAEIEVELVLGKLLSVEEIVNRLDAQQMTQAIERRLKQVLRRIVNDVMQESAPTLWAALPVQGKNLVYARVELDIPNVVSKMVRDFQQNVTEIFDIREMVVEQLAKDPELINEIFLKAGAKEFPFIERSGLYFGFLFGLPTMFIWSYYQLWWILPLGGLLVGYATNWIAIKIIFEPKRPRKVGFFTLQGMFLKRQKEVSRVYAEIIEKKLLNSQNITHAVLKGSGSGQLLELIELHVNDAIERYVAVAQPYFALAVGSEDYFRMKELAVKRIFEDSDKFLHYAHEYANSALNIGDDLRVKMEVLSPEEFEGVLRPAYKQDEWKLIVVGAILGMLAGAGQLYLMLL
ncbi:DUF445 domain-containing protein [Bowmanella yangjiangensis]|uniref:DUF445 family protein n=1 Tax=Bowmanella yangjiangensis TaxID=2811230 RepID=A0ABS3CPI1_9ALTE|nr:DUF445 family protein [Bowmanella yangjiangensis]MBN7819012.1 DUF445 family protein [Bowmanella yangjiangensis]